MSHSLQAGHTSRPFGDLRVLDFTSMMAGPYCSRWLADLGAEVIKIEPPEGDYMRSRPPLRAGNSCYFGHLNAGKKSIALDLKNPAAVDLVRDLVKTADILIENFRPGVMDRLGLSFSQLQPQNPRLIYCSISGFGQTGEAASRPAFAQIVHAASGFDLTNMSYQDGQDRPANTGIFIADVLAAIYAGFSVSAALVHRHKTRAGQHIDVTLAESMFSLLVFELQNAQFPASRRRPMYKPSRAKDGFVIIAAVSNYNFDNLFVAIGHPEWKDDPRFSSSAARLENWDELFSLVEAWTMVRTAGECERFLNESGVPCSRYRTVSEAIDDMDALNRNSLPFVQDAAGAFRVTNLPFKFSAAEISVGASVPPLGADTNAVLKAALGLSESEISELTGAGVFGPA